MTTHAIYTPRKNAALYLAWEFGIARARVLMAELPRDRRGWVNLTDQRLRGMYTPLHGRATRRSVERYANRIREVVAYQEGRLGYGLTAGGGCVDVS